MAAADEVRQTAGRLVKVGEGNRIQRFDFPARISELESVGKRNEKGSIFVGGVDIQYGADVSGIRRTNTLPDSSSLARHETYFAHILWN